MAECQSNLCDVNWGVDEYWGVKTGLDRECRTHTVFAHMSAAFVEASGLGEHTTRATSQASAADVADRGSGEAIVMSVGDCASTIETEWLKHTCMVVDREGLVVSEFGKLV